MSSVAPDESNWHDVERKQRMNDEVEHIYLLPTEK
jgi:hypothetical protein